MYTFRSGTKAIVWTDLVQTLFMVAAMVLMLLQFTKGLDLNPAGVWKTVAESSHARIFEFSDWTNRFHFFKQFFSGIFIVLVMTGLDQEMIQKNRTIHDLDKAQRNMYWYGFTFLPINLLLLVTGLLMYAYAAQKGIVLPDSPDDVLPQLATSQFAGGIGILLLLIGVVSATFSGADSSMTAITTSFCIDILGKERDERVRRIVHVSVAILFVVFVLIFRAVNSMTLIDAIYTLASYTYGPLLGLFAFGLLTKRRADDSRIPFIALAAPLLCFGLQAYTSHAFGYRFSYELLMLNGLITFAGLWLTSKRS
jgi:Na+/proline symporter